MSFSWLHYEFRTLSDCLVWPVANVGSEDETDVVPTYKEAFPPLPEKVVSVEAANEPAGAWTKIRPLKSSLITQVFHVPLEERKYKEMNQFGEGEQAKICLDIMQKTGAHLELSLAKDQGLSIMVSGKLEAVMKARKEIVAKLQTQASATVAIPKEHHRFVIGKNGEKLQELELKTATKIQIPRPDDPSNQIKITGTKEGIEKARHEILLISAEQDKRAVERINIEKVYHPFIAGAFNKVSGEMMQETGTRINIPPPSVNKNEIVITGEKEQVAQAVTRIKRIYEEKKKKTTTIAVEVKKSQHKYVIGPKGNSLQEILERTGVSVEIPPSDSNSETVILRGEPDKLGQALTEVYAKANSFTVATLTAPAWLHRFIIGKKGQTLSRITQQTPKVHIEFTDGEDRISMEGPTKEVKQVQEQIQLIVEDLVNRMDYTEITIDPKFHRHLIGKSGTNINRIKELYKVSVRIPPDNEKSNLIRIEGDPQGVRSAKKELLELASRMENERTKDLIIEHRFHRTIIGQKGEKVKEIRDKFPEVIINFPDPAQKNDVVQLRGPKNEVEKCAKFLQKVVAELVENSFSVSVPIFKQFHKNIIGKGGANIKKIREETLTRIDLPAENSNSEMIVITGKKANCELARNRILSIQKELANITEVEVCIPAKLHNSLIGAKGRFVRSIMEECGGVHIHFPTEGSGSDTVTIRGHTEEVDKAKKQLLHLAEEKQIKSFTAELRAKPEYHKFLIGRGGANIRKVRDNTGARIIFPTADDQDQELITIVGTEEAVKDAQRELEILIKNLDNVIEDVMTVDPKHHRHFVARRGQVLRDVADEYGGVMVSFPRTGTQSDRVTLKGAKDCVEAAKKRMQEIIEDLEAQVTIECVINQRFHRMVMGAKGLKVQQITKDHLVQIKFPEREENPGPELQHVHENGETNGEVKVDPTVPKKNDIIIISGRKERCEAARDALLLTISVDPKYHPKIIGRKGAVITQIRIDHDVNIQFPDKNDENQVGIWGCSHTLLPEQSQSVKLEASVDDGNWGRALLPSSAILILLFFKLTDFCLQDQITITGYEKNTETAKEAIMKIVTELEDMVSEDITLSHRVHARIIGARGKAIRKIMEDFKVDIRFPQSGAEDPDRVTVTGLPENVDEAIDHLLNLEEEYMSDVVENEAMQAYMKPASRMDEPKAPSKGFMVRDAPWTSSSTEKAPDVSSSEDFPSFGAPVAPKTSPWGPKRF
uniref:Vigilin n=1 Tax=Callorhinchus milii TaxID=7868 RepID=A0A4W3IQN5_CALMI